MTDKKQCEHHNFHVKNMINRLARDDGKITDFIMDTKVFCDDCKMPFKFKGLPVGLSGEKPSTCIMGLEGRFPLVPADGCLRPKSKMPGYSVRIIK